MPKLGNGSLISDKSMLISSSCRNSLRAVKVFSHGYKPGIVVLAVSSVIHLASQQIVSGDAMLI